MNEYSFFFNFIEPPDDGCIGYILQTGFHTSQVSQKKPFHATSIFF
jgi:hypothetical protein